MLNKTLSLLVIWGLVITTNFAVLAQSQISEVTNSQQLSTTLKKDGSQFKFGVNSAERGNQLLDRDYIYKLDADDLTKEKMRDADNARQNKKYSGIGKTTAILIGVGIAAAIIIAIVATRKNNNDDSRCPGPGIVAPCPPGCQCVS